MARIIREQVHSLVICPRRAKKYLIAIMASLITRKTKE